MDREDKLNKLQVRRQVLFSTLNQESVIPLNQRKNNCLYYMIYLEVHLQFWRKHNLPSKSRKEVESAPEILCTQVNRMTAQRRNSKTLTDAITEYKYIFQQSVAMSLTQTSLTLFGERADGSNLCSFYR